MEFDTIPICVQGGMDFPLPPLMRVKQKFSADRVENIGQTVRRELKKLDGVELFGKRIAITAGSRRIANLPEILRETVCYLRSKGAEPFIVPAMGSHAGATAAGQADFLRGLGLGEKELGAPIVSEMETVPLGTLAGGYTVYCDKNAFGADGIIVCGRIKPHTSIRGKVESGLCKMMVVGLGKHCGATSFHRQGYFNLAEILPAGGALFLEKAPVLCGLGIVENAYDQTARIEVIPPERLIEREEQLLNLARSLMPRFLLDEIDVLVVDQLGKDISGAGMDPNITGRTITPLPMEAPVRIGSIVALHLTKVSHGNATGIGGAEFTTKQFIREIDFGQTYTNVLTSGAVIAAQLPLILKNDEEAIRAALRCAPRPGIDEVKTVRILDTLHMGEILVSENYLPYLNAKQPDTVQILERGLPWKFNEGRLI